MAAASRTVLRAHPVVADDLLVRVEAVLADALVGAGAVIVLVHVDEAVALAHLSRTGGNEVDRAPPGVADEVDAVVDGLSHGLHVLLQVVDTVLVVDARRAVRVANHLVARAHAVLHHHQRNLIAVVDLVQGVAQALRVDLPAPVGALEVGVLATKGHVALRHLNVVRAHHVGHVVGERVEVHLAGSDVVHVALAHVELDAVLAPEAARVARVVAAYLHVGAIPVHATHLALAGQDVRRVARGGVAQDEAVHVAHLELRVHRVGETNHAPGRHKLVVERLVALLRRGLGLGGRPLKATDHRGLEEVAHVTGAAVDLVEREPVAHLVLVAVKDRGGVAHEEVDELAALPAVVLLHQGIGHLVVAEGHERLDAVLAAAVKDAVVEREAQLVGLLVVTVGEDAAPGDGHAKHVEAHLGKERDVLLVAVIEVDAVVVGVEHVGTDVERDLARALEAAAGKVVIHRGAAAVHVPRALKLVGRRRAAPEEALRESNCHDRSFLLAVRFSLGRVCSPEVAKNDYISRLDSYFRSSPYMQCTC